MISRQSLKAIPPIRVTYYLLRFFLLQAQIAIETLKDSSTSQGNNLIPVPPPRLRHRVHGNLDKYSFLHIGENIAQDIRELCKQVDRDIDSFESILDFGCGSGRVIRSFQYENRGRQFYGTDIDPDLIHWCQEHMPDISWSVNNYSPPLPFADETFDLIYGISVFTHLDERLQHAWLGELQRVAAPDAIIILSVHGNYCINFLEPSLQEEIQDQGFKFFVTGLKGKFKLDGLPDFYQTTYHTREYIEQVWCHYFEVILYVEQGINHHQDAVILRKR